VAWRHNLFVLQTPVTLWLHSANQNRNLSKTIKNIQYKVAQMMTPVLTIQYVESAYQFPKQNP
jgi:SPX domain protein involved in polyphosphate accumulation